MLSAASGCVGGQQVPEGHQVRPRTPVALMWERPSAGCGAVAGVVGIESGIVPGCSTSNHPALELGLETTP